MRTKEEQNKGKYPLTCIVKMSDFEDEENEN